MRQKLSMMVAIAACMGAGNALAEEAADHGGAVNASEIVTTVCAMCHGEDGNKMLTPETPKLGGQKADYLAQSLHEYKNGGRKNPIMTAVAQPLGEAEIEALAEYFAGQPSELYTLK